MIKCVIMNLQSVDTSGFEANRYVFPNLKEHFNPVTTNETFLEFGSYGIKGKMFWTR